MPGVNLKKKLISYIEELPQVKVKEVIDFVSYLRLKEDEWFVDFVNKRSSMAKAAKQSGKKFIKLENLQKEYK